MRIGRRYRYGLAVLVAGAGPALAACQTSASGAEAEEIAAAAVVEEAEEEGDPARITLTEESALRLGVETAPVEQDGADLTIPYSAVVYDAEGASWAFVEVEDRVYQRAAITIEDIEGDRVVLSAGPEVGAEVVTVAAAELVGAEAGISGGE